MIETEKIGTNVGHDLVQKVDLSIDQGHVLAHVLRGTLVYRRCWLDGHGINLYLETENHFVISYLFFHHAKLFTSFLAC